MTEDQLEVWVTGLLEQAPPLEERQKETVRAQLGAYA